MKSKIERGRTMILVQRYNSAASAVAPREVRQSLAGKIIGPGGVNEVVVDDEDICVVQDGFIYDCLPRACAGGGVPPLENAHEGRNIGRFDTKDAGSEFDGKRRDDRLFDISLVVTDHDLQLLRHCRFPIDATR